MDLKNRIAIYATYLGATAGIGFTLPFLPIYLGQQGLSDLAIGWISTLAALSALAQFPIGIWSDRIDRRKPFLMAALAILTVATWLLQEAHQAILLGLLVILFAENGICRAVIDSLTGAEVASLCAEKDRAAELGALRLWKPIGIIATALLGSWWAGRTSIAAILPWLTIIQLMGFLAAFAIRDNRHKSLATASRPSVSEPQKRFELPRDSRLWSFILAMVLFHMANAPGGVYLGLFLKRSLGATDLTLAYAFVASMLAWMIVVWPAGRIADRYGRKPMLVLTWIVMTARLLIVAVAQTPAQIVANQILDGVANGLFSVLAATWVTDRLNNACRVGEAQVIVGTSLVAGSALGPVLSGMIVEFIGYRGLFACLAVVGAIATAVLMAFVPETSAFASKGQCPDEFTPEPNSFRSTPVTVLAEPPIKDVPV